MSDDYDDELMIDPSALDVEWLEQPILMQKVCDEASECRSHMESMKEALEKCRAHLDHEIRNDPESFGIEKITEAVIQSNITANHKTESRIKKLNDATREYNFAMNKVRAVDMRKSALENLVKLLGMEYFASPIEPRDLGGEMMLKAKSKKAKDKVRKSMRSKRSK